MYCQHVLTDFITTELTLLLNRPPVSGSTDGLEHARCYIEQWLRNLRFDVVRVFPNSGEPILVAVRPAGATWVGFSGHYDVEHAGEGWNWPPFVVTQHHERLYARGIADNLGPLLLRFAALRQVQGGPSIVLILQGEEEVGSPGAHEVYRTLQLPPVSMWFEETGYFEIEGTQRLLLRRNNSASQVVVDRICHVASQHGRAVEIHDRYLNKAFGAHRCPFLTHLAGDVPYIAIGPNDPESRIHQSHESLALSNLSIAVEQMVMLLNDLGDNP